jgi:hypothetical protein
MAANATAFRNALTRIGINVATRTAIIENGFVTIQDLVAVQDKDLDISNLGEFQMLTPMLKFASLSYRSLSLRPCDTGSWLSVALELTPRT